MNKIFLKDNISNNDQLMISFPTPGHLLVGKSRMCIFSILEGFMTLKESLKNEIGERQKEVLYNAGFNGGFVFLDKLLEANVLKPDYTGLKGALNQYTQAGFGEFNFTNIDFEKKIFKVEGKDCFESWVHEEKNLYDSIAVCDYTRGVLAGFISAFYNKTLDENFSDIYCMEETCAITNKNYCHFIISTKSNLESLGLYNNQIRKPLTEELKQNSSNLEKTLKRLKAIEEISYACSNLMTSDLDTFSNAVLRPFCELTGADYGLIVLLESPEKMLHVSATYGFSKEFSDIYNTLKYKFNSDEVSKSWPSIKSMSLKDTILIDDIKNDDVGFSKFFKHAISPHVIKSVASIPLIINNKAVGALTKYYTKPHTFDSEEISFMKTTANIITSTIERNKLLEIATESENELAEANENLTQINKELDSFVYIASHDLREPLRTIESFASIVQDKLRERIDDEEKDYLFRIIKATKRMRKLIQDLTTLSRATRTIKENEAIDLKMILNEVEFELTAIIQSKGALIEYSDDLPTVSGSKEKISSIFKNLISNGIKFNKSDKPFIKIYLCNKKVEDTDKVCICIEDNGIGIEEEYHSKIFGLFQRLHNQEEYEGTGAGLAIVKKILEKYNCDIWLESKEGSGSKFYITLLKYRE